MHKRTVEQETLHSGVLRAALYGCCMDITSHSHLTLISFPILLSGIQVRLLEQQNEVLETKWSFLKGQKHGRNTIVPMLEACIGNLKKQLEALGCNRARLETQLKAVQEALETNKKM